MALYFSFIALLFAYIIFCIYVILMVCEKLVVKRVNDFYIIVYKLPHPVVALKMSRRLRRMKLPQEEVQQRLSRCTSFLCAQLPLGTYSANTHDRIIQGLEHMQAKGRAVIDMSIPKGSPQKQVKLYRRVFGRCYPVKELPPLQMYRVKFHIS